MTIKRKFRVGILLFVMLFVCMTLVPAISAQEN